MQMLSRTQQTLEGIDVSEYQGLIDWTAVTRSGKRFAAIKATEGLGFQDPYFPHNWAASRAQGIKRIAYHFLRPEYSGATQADYFHAYVRDSGRFAVGDAIMLDLEVLDIHQPKFVLRCAEDFVTRCIAQTVAGIFLYTGPSFWQNDLGNPKSPILANCPLWLADYGPSVPPLNNWPNGLSFWQYSDVGQVNGIRGAVDLDRFYGNAATLHELMLKGGRS